MKIFYILFLTWPWLLAAQTPQRYYVDSAAVAGLQNGQSWADAFTDLQAALALAAAGDEVWVARGSYFATSGLDRAASFEVVSGLQLYGGFSGGETTLDARDWETNRTVLSGDIGTPGDSTDNSYNIMLMLQPDSATVLDGFVLTGGQADLAGAPDGTPGASGAALYLQGTDGMAYATLRNCVFERNTAWRSGGAVYVNGSGAGSVAPRFDHCRFEANRSVAGHGGAVARVGGSWVERTGDFSYCRFLRNTAQQWGGAIYVLDAVRTDSLDVENCEFVANAAINGMNNHGDAIAYRQVRLEITAVRISHCRFAEHFSSDVIYMEPLTFTEGDLKLKVEKSQFVQNTVKLLFAESFANSDLYIGHCHIDSNFFYGTLLNATCLNTLASTKLLEYNIITNTNAQLNVSSGKAVFRNNVLSQNQLLSSQFFIHNIQTIFINCLIDHIEGKNLFYVYPEGSEIQIINSTFSNIKLTANPHTSGSFRSYIFNSIFAQNQRKLPDGSFASSLTFSTFDSVYLHSCLVAEPLAELWPNYRIFPDSLTQFAVDPLFADTAAGDFHLLPCSPAIDAGNTAALDSLGIVVDLDDMPRVQGPAVDIGAYEHPAFGLAGAPALTAACHDAPTGGAAFAPMHGCPPYTLTWPGGLADGAAAGGLPAGTYAFTLTDARGRTQVLTTTIPGSAPELTLAGDSLLCSDFESGYLTAQPGGGTALPAAFVWSDGTTGAERTDLPAGLYAVTATDANGCTAEAQTDVTFVPTLIATPQITPASGPSSPDGAIEVTLSGGHPPYLLTVWNTGDTTLSLNSLAPGFYQLTVLDAAGCAYIYEFEVSFTVGSQAPNARPGGVWPNPAAARVQVHFPTGATQWRLYDARGQDVSWLPASMSLGTIDLSGRAPGIYRYTFLDRTGKVVDNGWLILSR